MLNTVGAATAIRAALPGMKAHYKETGIAASVVLFSSVAVQQGFPNHAIIGAVKGAFMGPSLYAFLVVRPRREDPHQPQTHNPSQPQPHNQSPTPKNKITGGIEGLTRSRAAELAPAVRVNAIAPSLTDTPLATVLTRSPAMK